MNSLVVFLSVVALVAGKPSGLIHDAGIVAYSSPVIATLPAAVSHQSRLDIKSSPAVVATETIAPVVRVAEPALIATPAIATAAIAPAAVSSQSRIDIKSTPAITSTVVSAAPVAYNSPVAYSAPVGISAPVAYSAPIGISAPVSYSAPFSYGANLAYAGAVGPAFLKTSFGAPALYKSAAAEWAPTYAASAIAAGPTVPLDTPEVIAARAAHLEAKALAGAHQIHKRSAPLIGSPLVSTHLAYAATPIYSSVHATPLAYGTPIAYSSPLITKTVSVHPW